MHLLIFVVSCAVASSAGAHVSSYSYGTLNIRIDDNLPKSECLSILSSLENSIRSASQTLYTALNGAYYFGHVNIRLPVHWNEDCITQAVEKQTFTQGKPSIGSSTESTSDVTITGTHAILGDQIWTKQYGDCGTGGLQILASYKSLATDFGGKLLAKEWLKYRYGVFDETGTISDPVYTPCYEYSGRQHVTGCAQDELESVENEACTIAGNHSSNEFYAILRDFVNGRNEPKASLLFLPATNTDHMICNETTHNHYAPTKQNYFCHRQSVWEVIMKHKDFRAANPPPTVALRRGGGQPVQTIFHYKKPHRTRYVVIVDITLDISVRESWSFLRNAFRKWINYDLPSNTDVGIVLANGKGVERTLPLTALDGSANRDLVASFLPYSPADTRQMTCITCAVAVATKMHQQRISTHGDAATVILLIAPGMDPETNITLFQDMIRPDSRLGAGMNFVAVSYPALIANRQPLEALTDSIDRGMAFSVHEQKLNGEISFVTTYVQLVNVLMHITGLYFMPNSQLNTLPIEIHRNTIYDSGKNRNHFNYVSGEFYLEKTLGQPAGFYIYTHSAESPLIHTVRLISPSSRIYSTRSDQRMQTKQISIISPLNETGRWRYEIQRYPGNPQPHIVQVMATPQPNQSSPLLANSKTLGPIADFKTTETMPWAPLLPHITVKSWVEKRSLETTLRKSLIFLLYCEVMYGSYYPVRNAYVNVKILHYDKYLSPINEYEVVLRDTGYGDSDIQLGDGIYSRNIEIHEEGIYMVDFYVKGIPQYTYTTRSTVFKSDQSNNDGTNSNAGLEFGSVVRLEFEEIMKKGASSDHNGVYMKMTGGFERYGPQLTFHIDANALADTNQRSTALRHILNLRCNHRNVSFEFIECSWPDLDGCSATKTETVYQLRYAWSLFDLITNYDDAPVLFNGTQYDPLLLSNSNNCSTAAASSEGGDIVNYKHAISQDTQMYGKHVNIALISITSDGMRSPISNVAQLYIPPQVKSSEGSSSGDSPDYQYPLETEPSVAVAPTATYNNDDGDRWNTSIARTKAASHMELLMWILPFSLLFLLLCSTVCIYCYITRCRLAQRKSSRSPDTSDAHPSPKGPSTSTTPKENNIIAPVREHDHPKDFSHSDDDAIHPAHQSIGIPIIGDMVDITPHVYTIGNQQHGMATYDNTMNSAEYHSHYQSQTYNYHQNCQLSNVEMLQPNILYADSGYCVDDGMAPVVPPLPLLIPSPISDTIDHRINCFNHSYDHSQHHHQHEGMLEQSFHSGRNVTVV